MLLFRKLVVSSLQADFCSKFKNASLRVHARVITGSQAFVYTHRFLSVF